MNLKLDTLHKKPKVYHIGILTAGMGVLMGLLFGLAGVEELWLSCLLLSAYFLTVTVLLIRDRKSVV